MAAQRTAGDAFSGPLKPQLRPSALRPVLPAAKAALEAVMQTTRKAAAAISISSLMDVSSTLMAESALNLAPNPHLSVRFRVPKSARSLHRFTPAQCTAAPAMVPVQGQDA